MSVPVASSIWPERHGPSYLAPDLTIRGEAQTRGVIEIDGVIEGGVQGGVVIVLNQGRVRARVTADVAVISGEVKGAVKASSVTFTEGCDFEGDIEYDILGAEPRSSVNACFHPAAGVTNGVNKTVKHKHPKAHGRPRESARPRLSGAASFNPPAVNPQRPRLPVIESGHDRGRDIAPRTTGASDLASFPAPVKATVFLLAMAALGAAGAIALHPAAKEWRQNMIVTLQSRFARAATGSRGDSQGNAASPPAAAEVSPRDPVGETARGPKTPEANKTAENMRAQPLKGAAAGNREATAGGASGVIAPDKGAVNERASANTGVIARPAKSKTAPSLPSPQAPRSARGAPAKPMVRETDSQDETAPSAFNAGAESPRAGPPEPKAPDEGGPANAKAASPNTAKKVKTAPFGLGTAPGNAPRTTVPSPKPVKPAAEAAAPVPGGGCRWVKTCRDKDDCASVRLCP